MLNNMISRVKQYETQPATIYHKTEKKQTFLPKSHYIWDAAGYLNALHDFVFCEDSFFNQENKAEKINLCEFQGLITKTK